MNILKTSFRIASMIFTLAMLIAMTAAACNDPTVPKQPYPQVQSYGNGVFYFPYTGDDFGKALSAWRTSHSFSQACQIVTITPDDTATYGYTKGYFVITWKGCE